MGRLWLRRQIKTHPVVTALVTLFLALVVLVIIGGYRLHWDWTGFNGNIKSGKTLWDWMQLLFIPVVLAVAGFWFNHRERKAAEKRADNERKAAERRAEAEQEIEQQRAKSARDIAEGNQQEAALQEYINKMSELLLHENLRKSKPEEEVRKIARVRTLTVLPRLNGDRKRSVLEFLYEAGLILRGQSIINLYNADLSMAYLQVIDLHGADLSGANLHDADINGANLQNIDLSGAFMANVTLQDTDMRGANLKDADLTGADLWGANVTQAQLNKADLAGAKMPDGSMGVAKFSFAPKSQ